MRFFILLPLACAAAFLAACQQASPTRPGTLTADPNPMWSRLPVFKTDTRALPPTWGKTAATPHAQAHLDTLAAFMCGSFDSSAQAAEDESYLNILLHMARIWPERTDGIWLYVEQAMATAPAKPYRQRVYKLSAVAPASFKSEVFELPGKALDYVGAWQDASKLASVKPDTLKPRDGCELFLDLKDGPSFAGATRPKSCPSELKGASYAVSDAVITNDTLISWDRGYNAAGEQVWGATKGGYRFVKQR